MKKIFVIFICLYIFQTNTFQNMISHFVSKETSSESEKNIYQTFLSLEEKYNDKILKSYNIDPDALKQKLSQIEGEKAKVEYKKQYIMDKTNISESEYQEKFVHPVSQLRQSSTESIEDIKNAYQYVKDKVENIENLINLFKD